MKPKTMQPFVVCNFMDFWSFVVMGTSVLPYLYAKYKRLTCIDYFSPNCTIVPARIVSVEHTLNWHSSNCACPWIRSVPRFFIYREVKQFDENIKSRKYTVQTVVDFFDLSTQKVFSCRSLFVFVKRSGNQKTPAFYVIYVANWRKNENPG